MLIVMMLAGGAPPVAGLPARKNLAVAYGALTKTRMGRSRAQQQREQQTESDQAGASHIHLPASVWKFYLTLGGIAKTSENG
jgi:hypothetical protein